MKELKIISTILVLGSLPLGVITKDFLVFSGVMAIGLIGFMISRFGKEEK